MYCDKCPKENCRGPSIGDPCLDYQKPEVAWPDIPGACKIQHPERGVVYSFTCENDAYVAAAGKDLLKACQDCLCLLSENDFPDPAAEDHADAMRSELNTVIDKATKGSP